MTNYTPYTVSTNYIGTELIILYTSYITSIEIGPVYVDSALTIPFSGVFYYNNNIYTTGVSGNTISVSANPVENTVTGYIISGGCDCNNIIYTTYLPSTICNAWPALNIYSSSSTLTSGIVYSDSNLTNIIESGIFALSGNLFTIVNGYPYYIGTCNGLNITTYNFTNSSTDGVYGINAYDIFVSDIQNTQLTLNYSVCSVPVNFKIIYGTNFNTGFVGESSYNASLTGLGFSPAIKTAGTYNINIQKSTTAPFMRVLVYSPLSGASWDFNVTFTAISSISVAYSVYSSCDITVTPDTNNIYISPDDVLDINTMVYADSGLQVPLSSTEFFYNNDRFVTCSTGVILTASQCPNFREYYVVSGCYTPMSALSTLYTPINNAVISTINLINGESIQMYTTERLNEAFVGEFNYGGVIYSTDFTGKLTGADSCDTCPLSDVTASNVFISSFCLYPTTSATFGKKYSVFTDITGLPLGNTTYTVSSYLGSISCPPLTGLPTPPTPYKNCIELNSQSLGSITLYIPGET